VLDGVLESIGLGGDVNVGKRLIVLRAIDKLDRLEVKGVRALLGKGRTDESGDYTKGAGLAEKDIEKIMVFLAAQKSTLLSDVTNLSPSERTKRGVVHEFRRVDGDNESYFVESNAATLENLKLHFGSNPVSRQGL